MKFFSSVKLVLSSPLSFHFTNLIQFTYDHDTFYLLRSLLEEYGRHLARLASTIFEAISKNLKLDPEQSKLNLCKSTGQIRVYRYLPCSEANQGWGLEAHTDSSVLSILNQDEVGGLQIFKDDLWLDVDPCPNTLVLNLGDMMQVL